MSWEKVKLSEITNNLDSRRKPLNQTQRNAIKKYGLYPYIGANNIQDFVDEYLFDEKILCVSEDGGSWGAFEICSKIYTGKTWVNNHAHVLTSKENLNLEYLMHCLNFQDLNPLINGATRGKLTKKALESIQIPLPPLSTQKAIAEKLDKADALRKKDRELLKQYDELAQSVFIEMFGDPVRNEKGWEKIRIIDVIKPISKINRNYEHTTISYIDISSVDNKINEVTNSTEYELFDRPSRAQQILERNDILFSTVRPNLKNIAVNLAENKIGSTGFYVLRANSKIETLYLFKLLLSDSVTKEFENMVSGANYPALRSVDLDNFEIILPPLPLQQKFASIIQNIEQQKQKVKLQAEESENLFQALLQESFG